MDEPPEPLFQFEEDTNSTGYGYCAQRQGDDRDPIARCEETKASEKRRQPKNEERDERFWCSLSDLLEE